MMYVNRNGAYDEWIHGGSDPDGRVSISTKKMGDGDSFPQDLSSMASCLRTIAGDSVARKTANGALWLNCRSQGCLGQLDWRLGTQKRGWNVHGYVNTFLKITLNLMAICVVKKVGLFTVHVIVCTALLVNSAAPSPSSFGALNGLAQVGVPLIVTHPGMCSAEMNRRTLFLEPLRLARPFRGPLLPLSPGHCSLPVSINIIWAGT